MSQFDLGNDFVDAAATFLTQPRPSCERRQFLVSGVRRAVEESIGVDERRAGVVNSIRFEKT